MAGPSVLAPYVQIRSIWALQWQRLLYFMGFAFLNERKLQSHEAYSRVPPESVGGLNFEFDEGLRPLLRAADTAAAAAKPSANAKAAATRTPAAARA